MDLRGKHEHYVMVVQKDPDSAYGVYFPDLKGCYAAGNAPSEAGSNGRTSLRIYAEDMLEAGRALPPPRSIEQLLDDPDLKEDIADGKAYRGSAAVCRHQTTREHDPGTVADRAA